VSRRRWPWLLPLALWPPLAWAAAHALRVAPDCRDADAIAILAGASAWPERVEVAADLFARGAAPRVVLTDDGLRGGWSQAEQRNPFFVERAAAGLRERGVPDDGIEILAPPVTGGTFEEIAGLRAWAEAAPVASLTVVTSVYHGRRTRQTLTRAFRSSGVTPHLCARAATADTPAAATWWLHGRGWRDVGSEFPKIVYYWLR
jgi:uncharacterized SAM-binding protein YcdF (DUF218 family)